MAGDGQRAEDRRPQVRAGEAGDRPSRIASRGYAQAVTAHLRARLRGATAVLATVGIVLFLVGRGVDLLETGSWAFAAGEWIHLGAVAGVLGLNRAARAATSARALRAIDVALTLLVVAACLAVFEATWEGGVRMEVEFLGLLLLARAVAVPGEWRRTLLLSATAPIGVLAIEWAHGVGSTRSGLADVVVWDQAFLWLAVVLAAWTSRSSAALRRRAFDATQVDQYVLGERIGGGAMGEVFRATHSLMRRPTALKLLRRDIADEHTIARFEQEVRQTARLTHPNTISIFDYGHTADGAFYYAMELCDGSDLERIVEATGPFPASRAIHALVQACGSLEEAHAAGLVHRDVKPSNILLARRGLEWDVVKVTDFGLVKETGNGRASLTGIGEVCGSPHTIAPETLRGEPVTSAADVYALGAVGCFLLTGRPIFPVGTVAEFVAAHLHEPPTKPSSLVPSVPDDLEAVLLRCLAKDPEDRWPSVAALRTALLACADAHGWGPDAAADWWSRHAERVCSPPGDR